MASFPKFLSSSHRRRLDVLIKLLVLFESTIQDLRLASLDSLVDWLVGWLIGGGVKNWRLHSSQFHVCMHPTRPISIWFSQALIFPTKYVIPKSLKFSHWPSKTLPKTNIALENKSKPKKDRIVFLAPLSRGELLVSGRIVLYSPSYDSDRKTSTKWWRFHCYISFTGV